MPIEQIVEFDVGLGIMPMPNLERDFDVDSFLTLVPDTIVVDQNEMLNQPERYRFSLAHEVGHWLLHRSLYEMSAVTNLESYFAAYEALDADDLGRYEFQARNLGGRILLPRAPFLAAAEKALPSLKKLLPADAGPSLLCKGLAKMVAPTFEVTEQVTETRLVGDALCEELGIRKPPKWR